MSSNITAPTTAATAASTAATVRLKWDDLDGIRTLIFVLYKRYPYWNASQYAQILNEICKDQFAAMGFPNGIDNHRIGAEWRGRKKAPAKEKWKIVRSKGNDEEEMRRDRWEGLVRITAGRVGLKSEQEVGSEGDDDGVSEEEDEDGEVVMMTKERFAEDARAFRAKHEKRSG